MRLEKHKHMLSHTVKINSVVTIFYQEFSEGFVFRGEKHNFWELVYVDKGTAVATADGKETVLKQGSIIFHKPNEFHAIRAEKDDPPNILVLTFISFSPSMSYFEGMSCTVPKALRYHISEILENAANTFELPFRYPLKLREAPVLGGEQMIKTHIEQLFIELMRNSSGNAFFTSREMMDNKTVNKCIEYIENNVYGKVTLDDICEFSNYSRTYVCTLFKSITGKTVVEYCNERKIEEAKMLIRKRRHTFSQISDLLGFSSPTYFSRIFTKIARMTPTQYRDSVR